MIVHIFNSSVVSGPETLVLPALKKLGSPVAVVILGETRLGDSWEGPVAYAKGLGLETYFIPVEKRWDRRAFAALRDILDRLDTRVAHAHDVKASIYLLQAIRLKKGFKAAIVSTHHGAAARQGKIRLYEEIYVRWALPKFQAVLCVCRGDRESLIRRGVPAARIFIHYNGVDRTFVPSEQRMGEREGIRRRWGKLGADELILGAVARLSPEKRHDRMLNALAILKRDHPELPVRFVAFGTGALEGPLKTLTSELGLEKEVRWMGYSKTIGQEMAGFDLLLCLSDGEGIPINLIEAGWSGTPVFSTSVGGIPDLIDSEETGFLVRKTDTDEAIASRMAEVLARPELLARVGNQFQKRIISGFSEGSWLEQLRGVYGSLVK